MRLSPTCTTEIADFNATKREQIEREVERTLSKQHPDTVWQASRQAVRVELMQEPDSLDQFTPEKKKEAVRRWQNWGSQMKMPRPWRGHPSRHLTD